MDQYYTSKQFKAGYDAAALCEPLDKTKSQEWQNGWHEYQEDMDRSELQHWI